MTAVQSLPNLQSLPRLGWNSTSNGGSSSFGADEVNRATSGRKPLQRSNSSSSDNSTKNSSIATSPTKSDSSTGPPPQQKESVASTFVRGFWAAPKTDPPPITSSVNARVPLEPVSSNPQPSFLPQPGTLLATPKVMQNSNQPLTNGTRMGPQPPPQEAPALLILLPMNATFERKQINVPLFPEMLRIGRQTNAKTVPTPANGYFDSKVLSRQHAEVWADRSGKVWIRDVKSSNGTFVNGVRLSPESRDSEPHELRENDMLELGIDIVSEDQKSIVHHKVSAKVEHAGVPTNATSVLDLNMADIEPGSGGGLSMPNGAGARRASGASALSSGRSVISQANGVPVNGYGVQKHMGAWINPVSIEQVVKRLTTEMRQAKQQTSDLHRTGDFIGALLNVQPGQEPPKAPADLFQPPLIVNGVLPQKELISPFSQPPAPPPQLPLPEKPDVPPSSSPDGHILHSLKRHEMSPINGKMDSPTSQILQLVEALSSAKKEIDNQGSRVRELEEELRRERRAREQAEESVRLFLGNMSATKTTTDSDNDSIISQDTVIADDNRDMSPETQAVALSTARLQERLDTMLHEMRDLKDQIDHYKNRAETAEKEKSSLADMVEQIRSGEAVKSSSLLAKKTKGKEDEITADWSQMNGHAAPGSKPDKHEKLMNGTADKSILQQKQLQELASAAMSLQRDDRFMQSAPYASIVGVVLIGMGIMAYINGWQKLERS